MVNEFQEQEEEPQQQQIMENERIPGDPIRNEEMGQRAEWTDDDVMSMCTSVAAENNLLRGDGIEVRDIKAAMLERFDTLDNSMVSGRREITSKL